MDPRYVTVNSVYCVNDSCSLIGWDDLAVLSCV